MLSEDQKMGKVFTLFPENPENPNVYKNKQRFLQFSSICN